MAAVQTRARWFGAGAGVGVSALLHVLVIGTVLFGSGGKHAPSHREGLGANAIASTEEAVATLILIEEPSTGPHEHEDSLEKLASHGVVLQNFRLTIVSPEPTIDAAVDVDDSTDEKPPAAADSSGDRQMQAALFGRYIGQIQARVERAWLRPRTAIGAESFECRVQVLQNKRGDVLEVTVQRCNGDVRWGLSLVHAIERASPLPAPPDPAVFAETLQLSFHSAELAPGGDEEGFEPRASLTANTPR